jgi:hypothetical protein
MKIYSCETHYGCIVAYSSQCPLCEAEYKIYELENKNVDQDSIIYDLKEEINDLVDVRDELNNRIRELEEQ